MNVFVIIYFLSGECKTLSEASKKFNIARSTLRDLVKADRKYTGRGRKSHVFTDEEEKIISERFLIIFSLVRGEKEHYF